MIQDAILKVCQFLTIVVGCSILLTNCNIAPQSETTNVPVGKQNASFPTDKSQAVATLTISTTTKMSNGTAVIQLIPTQTTVEESSVQNLPSSTSATLAPSVMVTKLSTPTFKPSPSPTRRVVECDNANVDLLPDKAFPTEININDSHLAFDQFLMYMAVDQYIGVFDITNPGNPKFWGFWEFPDIPEISGIKVNDGVAYIASGSSLHVLNLSSLCHFSPINTIDMPFHIFHLEIENSRLYVGGVLENQELDQVAILSIDMPDAPEILSFVDLSKEPTAWSVSESNLYSYLLESNEVFLTDIDNPSTDTHTTYPVNVGVDSGVLANSSIRIIGDTLYLFSWTDGVSIISDLGETSPNIEHNPESYVMMGVFDVQDEYIFIGDSGGCDGVGCDSGSRVIILDAIDGKEISRFVFEPHDVVYKYQMAQDDFVYALSEKWLFVVDISDISNPVIVSRVLLIT